jgi:uncharacterized phiE125 gp8 family phage protein
MSVTLTEFKEHLRVTDDDQNASLQAYLNSAIDYVETQTGQKLSNKARTVYFDELGDMELPGDSPTSIVVQYVDTDGATQTLSSALYDLKTHKAIPYLTKAFGASYPSVRAQDAAVDVAYTSGYTTTTLPGTLKAAVLILAASLYEVREEFVIGTIISKAPTTVERLIHPYVVFNA